MAEIVEHRQHRVMIYWLYQNRIALISWPRQGSLQVMCSTAFFYL